MTRWLCRPQGRCSFRPFVQELEDRCVLAAPVLDTPPVALNVPASKTLIVPITASDPDGGSVSYSVTSSNPQVQVISHTNNTYLDLEVAGFGHMQFQLFNDLTPHTAALIGGMVQGEFYDGLTFHRAVNGFMIQGGDPQGNGGGDPGFEFDDEFHPGAIFSGSGQLAMANSGKDTNGSQFFITDGPQRLLDFNHTIFGQLVRGFDVLRAIEATPVKLQNPNDPNSERSKPVAPVVITRARIVRNTTDAVFTLADNGAGAGATTTLTVTATSSTGGSTTRTFTAQVVTGGNAPPILDPVSDRVSSSGAPVTIHLTHTDPEHDAGEFGAAIMPASSGNATLTITTNPDGSADVVVTRKPGFLGAVQVIVGVRTVGATSRGSTAYPWDVQVIDVAFGDKALTLGGAGPVSATEGAARSFTLASLTDADPAASPADYRVSINWGDGSPLDQTTGQVVLSGGQLTVKGTHTYREAGTYPVHVVVVGLPPSGGADNGGATAEFRVTAVVQDAALSSQPVVASAAAGRPTGPILLATFTDANPFAAARDFAARIDWPDGTSSAGTIVAVAGGFGVFGSHVFAAPGEFPVGVVVTEELTAGTVTPATTTTTTQAVIVLPPPPAPPLPAPLLPPPSPAPPPQRKQPKGQKKKVKKLRPVKRVLRPRKMKK